MLGLSRVPSRYTWWSLRALYTAARTWEAEEICVGLGPLPRALCSPSRGRWVQETKGPVQAYFLKPALESTKILKGECAWILAGMGYRHPC